MQQSMLKFMLKGEAREVSPDRLKEQDEVKMKIEGCVCDSMYRIPLSNLSEKQIALHERNLTMIPTDNGFNTNSIIPFKAFFTNGEFLAVPRMYGFEHFGAPQHDKRTLGSEIAIEFTGSLKDHQIRAVDDVLSRFDTIFACGCLVLPCGYGKTVCGLNIIARTKRKTLVLVHKNFLVQQWHERAKMFLPGASLGKIQQNTLDTDADIVVGMIQSLSKREYPAEILNTFGLILVDEAHHVAAPVFSKALRYLNGKYIVGLSATPERRDGMTPLLYWSLGSICHRIERTPEHTLVSCMIYEGGKRKEITYRDGRVSLPLMLNNLVKDPIRNNLIADRIVVLMNNNRRIIVLSDRITQLHELCALVQTKHISAQDIAYYIGTTPAKDRDEAAKRQLILTTYSMAKEGLDIPILDTLILATPKGDVVQASGRIQRQHPNKKTPLIIDVVDTFSVFEQLRWKRWKFYRKEEFKCQTFPAGDDAAWFE